MLSLHLDADWAVGRLNFLSHPSLALLLFCPGPLFLFSPILLLLQTFFFLGAPRSCLILDSIPTLSCWLFIPCPASFLILPSSFALCMSKKRVALIFVFTLFKSLFVKLKIFAHKPYEKTKGHPSQQQRPWAYSQQSIGNWQYRKHSLFIAPPNPPKRDQH